MKKIIPLIFAIILSINLVSCGEENDKTESVDINSDIVKLEEVYDSLEFLNDEQQALFTSNVNLFNSMMYNAPHIFDIYNLEFADNELIEKNDVTYFVTDLSWEVFQGDVLKIFTQNFLNSSDIKVFSYNGNLAHINADGGFSIPEEIRYTDIIKGEEEISFKIVSYFYSFDNSNTGDLEKASFVTQREIVLIKDNAVWKIDYIGESVDIN